MGGLGDVNGAGFVLGGETCANETRTGVCSRVSGIASAFCFSVPTVVSRRACGGIRRGLTGGEAAAPCPETAGCLLRGLVGYSVYKTFCAELRSGGESAMRFGYADSGGDLANYGDRICLGREVMGPVV